MVYLGSITPLGPGGTPPPGPVCRPIYGSTVVVGGGAASYVRGTPVPLKVEQG
eukprot:CAMPEP_0180287692 /NCGR_PEP_ID=MMETSP0988-20121125/13536_1 /TAXON_ID=697907 /ORGANISM="non described non described, Strain CCMP2293" /LENGTH=52 /DNA_ID=CAMNT_0022262091 /DNA_START=112 /DNA_END=266 /DNA_ORIENTATION=+